MNDIILRPYEPRDQPAFRALNQAWIEKHFAIEDKDREVLGDPDTYILKPGGQILLAESDGIVVGCCALLRIAGGFELGKMAVADVQQGRGIGRKILLYAIETARRKGASRVYLESNHTLPNAIHLYEEAGFRHIPTERTTPSPYARSNVYMELIFENRYEENQV